MKILWLSHNVPYPPFRGVLQRNFHLIRELSQRAEVHLVALRQRALCPDAAAVHTARQALGALCASVDVFDIDWETSPAARVRGAASLLTRQVPYDVPRFQSLALRRHLAALGPGEFDALHVDTVGLAPYRQQLASTPAVLNHHNVESHMLARRAESEPGRLRAGLLAWQARRMRAYERRVATDYAANLVVSPLDGERLEGIVPGCRTHVVPNGVDVTYFDTPANTTPENFDMVMVGSHSWYPNGDAARFFLDDIWPRIREREPRARWQVVGANPDPRIQRAAENDPQIVVHGFVDDLREIVANAAVFLCPFRQGGGTRLKVLDGLAMRQALVSTTMGIEGIPVEDRVHALLADTPASFADRVLELFGDPALRGRLAEAGRSLVEARFSWAGIGEDLAVLYRSVAAQPPASALTASASPGAP